MPSADRSPGPERSFFRAVAGSYDALYPGPEDDVPFYVEQAIRSGGPVLELGCGTGRVLIPIAEAGIEIVGVDIAPEMLALAGQKVDALNADARDLVTLLEGDMRDLALEQQFALVVIPFRAFLHVLTVDDQLRTLEAVYGHLEPGGRLALNMFDPVLEILVAHAGPAGQSLRRWGSFTRPATGNEVVVWESRRYDRTRQWIHNHFIYEELDKHGRSVSRQHHELRLRWVYRYEMEHLLQRAGFEIEALHGDFEGGEWASGKEQVWVARRPE